MIKPEIVMYMNLNSIGLYFLDDNTYPIGCGNRWPLLRTLRRIIILFDLPITIELKNNVKVCVFLQGRYINRYYPLFEDEILKYCNIVNGRKGELTTLGQWQEDYHRGLT
jgi:hypothetical protein